ncbi:MAG: D-alanyl-D-alanine carboxypeptidase, partial [Candidatus Accumulibacter sp.]|nr:D-alanyl-D-alanine carboxypeptidase [Accumulibacter sp.]
YDGVQLYAKGAPVSSLKVWKGKESTVNVGFNDDLVIVVPKGFGPKVQTELVSQQPLLAPVTLGQPLATLKVSVDGKPYGEYPVLALEAVPAAGIVGRMIDTVRMWFN